VFGEESGEGLVLGGVAEFGFDEAVDEECDTDGGDECVDAVVVV